MMRLRTGIVCMIALGTLAGGAAIASAQVASAERLNLGLRGVYFVENQGQWSDASVEYGFKTRGLDIAFRESSFTMHLSRRVDEATGTRRGKGSAPPRIPFVDEWEGRPPLPVGIRGDEDSAPACEHLTLTVTFPGSNPVSPIGAKPQAATFNYYIGDDESRWASNVSSYGAIVYGNLYDGVDLLICGNDDGVLKYEFHIAPDADWTQIRIAYDGIDSLCIEESGDLRIKSSFGTLTDSAPLVWQEDHEGMLNGGTAVPAVQMSKAGSAAHHGRDAHSTRLPDGRDARATSDTIPARFELVNATTYRFTLDGPVDPVRALIIDPDVQWMVYLGGSGDESARGVAVDGTGNTLVTGATTSIDFAGRTNSHHGGRFDAFALKVSPTGQLQWLTYLGGSATDYGAGIAVDNDGNALVTGDTDSMDFAGANNSYHGGFSDVFALKVNESGQLLWMTYIGGSAADDPAETIAMDRQGNALITGGTSSTDFAGRNNAHHGGGWDAFALKASPSGEIEWMTYLGGSGGDWGDSIAVDSAGNALVTATAISTDFEGRINFHHGGSYDAIALKVSASGQLQWTIYLGGSNFDYGGGMAVDSADNALVTGYTRSTDFSGRNNSFHGGASDAFAVKVSPSGEIEWMTYLGGRNGDSGRCIAVDGAGNALVAGTTQSLDFEGRNNSHHGGNDDFFALKVSPSGDLLRMTYLGGSDRDIGYGLAVDNDGNALVTGLAYSTDFEGRINSHYGGWIDAVLVKLRIADGPLVAVSATCPAGGPIRIEWSDATPGGRIALIFARESGSFTIPPQLPCPGTQLGLGSTEIQLVFQGLSGPDGSRTFNASAGPNACGGYLQLLDFATCATSNVVRIE